MKVERYESPQASVLASFGCDYDILAVSIGLENSLEGVGGNWGGIDDDDSQYGL